MCTVQDVGYLALEDVLVSPACKAADDDGASELPEEDPLEDTAALSAAACVPTHVVQLPPGIPPLLWGPHPAVQRQACRWVVSLHTSMPTALYSNLSTMENLQYA